MPETNIWNTPNMTRPFIDFYNRNNIIPTHQNHVDFTEQVKRRLGLHMSLGIPLEMIRGFDVLEFGPGGGFNALTLLEFNPKRYDFVEAATASLELLHRIESKSNIELNIYALDFHDFETDWRYDLVLAENCIPGQENPTESLKRVSKFVKNSGYLIVTANSKIGMLSEILKSVFGSLMRKTLDYRIFKKEATRIFDRHLSSLGTQTRTVDDWIMDTIEYNVHSFKTDFSLPEIMKSLPEFIFCGSSPAFFRNFNWYKRELDLESRRLESVNSQYEDIQILFLDQSISLSDAKEIPSTLCKEILECGEEMFNLCKNILEEDNTKSLNNLIENLYTLSALCEVFLLPTSRALKEVAQTISALDSENLISPKPYFEKWWGRSTTYVSLKREIIEYSK